MRKIFKSSIATYLISLAAVISCHTASAQTVTVYGPGGPAPAFQEAAASFEKQTGNKVMVTAGPTNKWLDQAKQDADIIYSGSEYMMTDFTTAMAGKIVETSITPLYIRPLAMLVRPGNPKHIKHVKDLAKPGTKILVVNGAGQTGSWEDMAGRKGELSLVKNIRRNIVGYAANSAAAKESWINNKDIDVWLIWNIWQVSNPTLAQTVPIDKDYAIYRDTGVALTQLGTTNASAKAFVDFLQSRQGEAIFKKWGWSK